MSREGRLAVVAISIALAFAFGYLLLGRAASGVGAYADDGSAEAGESPKIEYDLPTVVRMDGGSASVPVRISNDSGSFDMYVSASIGDAVLWESGRMLPGQSCDSMTLSKTLEPGEYPLTIRYGMVSSASDVESERLSGEAELLPAVTETVTLVVGGEDGTRQ